MQGMDKNAVIGLTLIFILFIVWQQLVAPSPEEIQAQQLADSLRQVEQAAEQALAENPAIGARDTVTETTVTPDLTDSARIAQLSGTYGPFAAAALGSEELITLENDVFIVTFTNKGGRIKQIELKDYEKIREDKKGGKEFHEPLYLLEDDKNRFEYLLPIGQGVRTGELYFTPTRSGNTIAFRAATPNGGYVEQRYTLQDGSYLLDYDVQFKGLENVFANDAQNVQLHWVNYLDAIEVNHSYERNYSTVYFKPVDDGTDYCSCTSDDIEKIDDQRLQWVSHSNQFFNSTLIAENGFAAGELETQVMADTSSDLKMLRSDLLIPYGHSPDETFSMGLYVGPNDFKRLQTIGYELTDIIPFGRSIFGAINRWVIRPIFNFLDNFIGSKGLSILALTFLVKLLMFPLSYRMLYSQSRMQALKPYIEKMKEKHKDDQQQQQMETMKLYREYGVNPLGGCFPMLIQLPIWFALYRFFPASLEFRQANFLWANDLSSYDVIARFPFTIPFGFGSHLSLFALLWAVTTLIYTYYNTRHMDFGTNPAMKWMQYIMPVMFLGFFNSFASGLTCYLLFSNLVNIGQTVVAKNFIIDQEKIKHELEENRKNPKKKSGFQERLEAALKEQQKRQGDLEQQRSKKGGRKK